MDTSPNFVFSTFNKNALLRLKKPEHFVQALSYKDGGEGGIRTLDTFSRIHTFQACSFSLSDTSPNLLLQ
ncbi:protein of unknown function [Xenorhabdus poinarii G6]|uniref:Uncharacterized protein n=1 Tax=Xenorhabdus poinarii G6 TaxID=1354304 RepID=A0A068R397_9GAMM|nr:protein of unknown function [Xenorhabdus poinarii G6]